MFNASQPHGDMTRCAGVVNEIGNHLKGIILAPTHPQVEGDASCCTTSNGWTEIHVHCLLQHCWYVPLHKSLVGEKLNSQLFAHNQPPQS